MEKRISLADDSLLCEIMVVLTDDQLEKMESEELREKIDNIAKDMHISWHVEKSVTQPIGVVGRKFPTPLHSAEMHSLEIVATNFMSAIEKLELQPLIEFGNEEKQHLETLEFVKKLSLVKKLLHDMNLPSDDDRHVRGALIVDKTTHPLVSGPTCWGMISHNLLKEMCELYLKEHGQN